MIKYTKIISLLVLCILINNTYAQVCTRDNTPQSIAPGNFELNANNSGGAEIQDKISGLTWKRCVYGQAWNGISCTGSPIKVTWQEALQLAVAEGWRIPNVKELSLIIDHQCIAPPLHETLFPNAPASEDNGLWSSTPHLSSATETHAWWVDLLFGTMKYRPVTQLNFALFVR